MNRVAVIIVNYNAGEMLRGCLEALSRQTVQPARILVIDNGSVDRSVESCEHDFPQVEFHRMNANLGFARANNIAATLVADCEWLALINPDAFAGLRWIELLLDAARRYPDADAFASCMVNAEAPTVIDGAGDCYRSDGIAWPRLQGETVGRIPQDEAEVFAACGGAGLYRRKTFIDAGGFNERYFCYHEDVDLGFRMRLLGYRCRFVPRAAVRHMGSAIAGKGSDFSVYHAHRNMVWTYVRNMPGAYFWLHLPAHVMTNLVVIGLFVIRGRGRLILRAKWHALRALPAVWRERRVIQQSRRVSADVVMRAIQRGNPLSSLVRKLARRIKQRMSGREAY